MTLLPDFYHVGKITPLSAEGYTVEIHLNPSHPVFEGHFPDNPIAPGVCMIQITKDLTETIVGKKLFLIRASNVKFTALINPYENSVLQLQLEIFQLEDELIKVKGVTSFDETVALKLSVTYGASFSRGKTR